MVLEAEPLGNIRAEWSHEDRTMLTTVTFNRARMTSTAQLLSLAT